MIPAIAAAAGPLLAAAAPAATKALLVGAGSAAGGVLGRAAAGAVVDAVQSINSFGQPQGAGQQRMQIMVGTPGINPNAPHPMTTSQYPVFY